MGPPLSDAGLRGGAEWDAILIGGQSIAAWLATGHRRAAELMEGGYFACVKERPREAIWVLRKRKNLSVREFGPGLGGVG